MSDANPDPDPLPGLFAAATAALEAAHASAIAGQSPHLTRSGQTGAVDQLVRRVATVQALTNPLPALLALREATDGPAR